MRSGFLKAYINRWLGGLVRNALINDFVRHVRVMPGGVPLSRIWRTEGFRSDKSFHVSVAGVRIATIGSIEVSRYRRRATISSINVHAFAQRLDIELALLQGFAKAVRAGYGINAIVLCQTGPVGTWTPEALFPSLGAVRIGVSTKNDMWTWRTDLDPHRTTRLNFQRRINRGGAFDEGTGVSIHNFRTEAGGPSPPDYLFSLKREGVQVEGTGILGLHDHGFTRDGKRERFYPLDATHPATIRMLLELREVLPTTEDDFSFLQGLALGFIISSCGERRSRYECRHHPMVTTAAALSEVGVPLPDHIPVAEDGTVVLAEVVVPIEQEEEDEQSDHACALAMSPANRATHSPKPM